MRFIPYGHQWIDNDDIKEVVKVLKTDWITQGPRIKEFEEALCKYTGAKYAVAVSHGTAALYIACLAAGIKDGDEVIVSPLTFIASVNCVLNCGGTPVFADIREDTANIDPEKVKKRIRKRTKALIPVHFAGNPCRLEEMSSMARKNGLVVIEDATHALGALYKGSKIGSCKYSDMAIFSFHPIKAIATGEGGAVLTNNAGYHKKLLMLRNHGIAKSDKSKDPWHYEMRYLSGNYRITDIQSALGVSQMKKLDKFIGIRRDIAQAYKDAFSNNPYFNVIPEDDHSHSAHHLYPILLKDGCRDRKKSVFLKMRKKGLGVQVHYVPVYRHQYYRDLGFKRGECPKAEDFYRREISIPIYPAMKNDDVEYVINTIPKCFL